MNDPKPQTSAVRIQAAASPHKEHAVPIFATSSFVFDDSEEMRAAFAGEIDRNIYSRFTNPNVAEPLSFSAMMAAKHGATNS